MKWASKLRARDRVRARFGRDREGDHFHLDNNGRVQEVNLHVA